MPREGVLIDGEVVTRGGEVVVVSPGGTTACCCAPAACPFWYGLSLCLNGPCVMPTGAYLCSTARCPETGQTIQPGDVVRLPLGYCYRVLEERYVECPPGQDPPAGFRCLPAEADLIDPRAVTGCRPTCGGDCVPVDGYVGVRPCPCNRSNYRINAVFRCTPDLFDGCRVGHATNLDDPFGPKICVTPTNTVVGNVAPDVEILDAGEGSCCECCDLNGHGCDHVEAAVAPPNCRDGAADPDLPLLRCCCDIDGFSVTASAFQRIYSPAHICRPAGELISDYTMTGQATTAGWSRVQTHWRVRSSDCQEVSTTTPASQDGPFSCVHFWYQDSDFLGFPFRNPFLPDDSHLTACSETAGNVEGFLHHDCNGWRWEYRVYGGSGLLEVEGGGEIVIRSNPGRCGADCGRGPVRPGLPSQPGGGRGLFDDIGFGPGGGL